MKKKKAEDLVLNQSFEIFKKCVNYIENKKCQILNNKLGFLYCISYIKYYSYHFAKIVFNEEFQNLNKNEIYIFLNTSSNFRKVIKIYILKVLNLLLVKNYKNFLDLIEEKQIFFNDFDFDENIPCSLNYLFIQNENFNFYENLRKQYSLCKNINYQKTKEIIELLNSNNFIVFYDLLINEELSNFSSNYKQYHYNKLSHFMLDISNKLKLGDETKKILNLFYDINLFQFAVLPSIENISLLDYEILLYSHKFAVISSMSTNKSIYSLIISQRILANIKEIYIPGGEPNDSLKIESGEQIKKYFENGSGKALYMCSCNNFYTIGGYGNPVEIFPCKACGQLIGGKEHIMIKRPGHVRIVKNIGKNDGTEKSLNELLNEVEIEKNINFKGFKSVKYEFFCKQNKNVRNMNDITYRILSFIFYSCIYYNEKLGYIKNDDLKFFYFTNGNKDSNNIHFILKKIWEILIEELVKKEINNIQCFLNMIIPEFSKIIISNPKSMNDPKDRDKFEILCNKVVENAISNYKNYYPEYINNNKKILKIQDTSIKSILQETSDIKNLSEENFPLINYFYVSNYPNYNKFLEQFIMTSNSFNLYPVIINYLNASQDETIKFLDNFNLINPFVKYTIDKYSNKISREDAKKKIIKNELDQDNEMKELFNNFTKGWNNIYKKLSNYDCHGKLPEKNISEMDCLAFCLNDNLEDNYGKYIATAYKDFITYQNNFLKPLIENNGNNEYLYPYSLVIKKEIIVQRATQKELVSLDISNDIYNSFEDLIYAFSYRNCFKENGDVYYLNYKENIFDFQNIEIELSRLLLPEKRLFSNEQNQDFIAYAFEGFNQNECIILDFKEKINEVKLLSNEEKTIFSNIVEGLDYKLILFNLQTLFLFFTKKRNIIGKEKLIEEINNLPKKIIKLDDEFIKIFNNPQLNINLNQLIDCYEYIEFLNYDKILANISKNINKKLDDIQINKLNKHFESKQNYLISKKDLGNAVRKFISRFLVGERFKNIDWNIFIFIKEKKELWNEKIKSEEKEEQFNKEIEKLDSIHILIRQSIDFYEKLGGERADERKINSLKKEKKKKKKGKKDLDY